MRYGGDRSTDGSIVYTDNMWTVVDGETYSVRGLIVWVFLLSPTLPGFEAKKLNLTYLQQNNAQELPW